MPDYPVAEPQLQRARVLAAVRIELPAGVTRHVEVHRERELCSLSGALDHLGEA